MRRDGASLGTKTKSIGRWGRGPECDFVFVPLFLNSGLGRAQDKGILYSAFRMAYGFVAAWVDEDRVNTQEPPRRIEAPLGAAAVIEVVFSGMVVP